MLLPRHLWVNSNIAFGTQFLGENFMTLDSDICALTIDGFFLARDSNIESSQPEASRLGDKQAVFAAWVKRVVTDFDNGGPDSR